MENIAFQPELRPALPIVYGARDYRDFRDMMLEIDRLLEETGEEERIVSEYVKGTIEKGAKKARAAFLLKTAHLALRYNILSVLTGISCRDLAVRVSDSSLFQWFTHTSFIDGVRPVSKSSIDRYLHLFKREMIEDLIIRLNQCTLDPSKSIAILRLERELNARELYSDSTCVKANIHFPIDWVLLRDAVRTLVKSVELIRAQGLVNRMESPGSFLRRMNKLCIEMTHTRRKKDSKKQRKSVLRKMKKLSKIIERHAIKHRDMLIEHRERTDWSEAEAALVINRMNNILEQLPQAIKQAHERIIGERKINSDEKILSLYEPDIHVIVRGKSSAEVEFGNALYLCEQSDGLIVDWKFMKEKPTSDDKLVKESVERIVKNYGKPTVFVADRGFDSQHSRTDLQNMQITNHICPRSVAEMEQRLADISFCASHKRRASTEARIAIIKNGLLGDPMPDKGFEHREIRLLWTIFTHNLRKLALMAVEYRRRLEQESSAA